MNYHPSDPRRAGRLDLATGVPFARYLNEMHHRIHRAQPFAPTPAVIRSADGGAYMHWTFYRDETCSCSTMNAMPFVVP